MIRAVANSRRALLPLAILAAGTLAAVLLALCLPRSGEDAPPTAAPPPGEAPAQSHYVEGVIGGWERINPLFAAENPVDEDLSRLIFAGLLRVNGEGRLLPDLAPLPEVGEDGRTYTFRLHPELRWHDGAPIRSLDFAFTINHVVAPDFQGDPRLKQAWTGVEVRTPDLRTIIIRLPAANASFLARFATLGILPEHLLQGLDGVGLFAASFNAHPVGAGPYRLEAVTSIEASLSANPRYHLGRPHIERITLRFLPDFLAARHALERGDVHGVFLRQPLSRNQMEAIEALEGFVQEDIQRALSLVLYLNNDQGAYFRDRRVRAAVSLAVDRDALVANSLLGLATPSSSAIAPGTWAYAPTLDSPPGDPAAAIELLAEAGWHQSPTTGVLIRQGSEFRLTIRTDSQPRNLALAREIARQLEPIGIRATVASTSFTVLSRDFLAPRIYDAAVVAWDQGPDPDPYYAWHSSQVAPPGGNIASHESVIIDALLERGRTTPNLFLRRDAYTQFQELWRRETPSVILAYPHVRYIRSAFVQSPPLGVLFTPADRFLEVHRWRLG